MPVSTRLKGGTRQYFRLLICICCGCITLSPGEVDKLYMMCTRFIDFVFVSTIFRLFPQCSIWCFHFMIIYNLAYLISAYHHSRREFESRSGELYSIQHVTCDRSVDSSTNKTDRHDIAEILLKVALNTITQVGHGIILFITSSSKTYTPSRISSPRLYTSCLVLATRARDCAVSITITDPPRVQKRNDIFHT